MDDEIIPFPPPIVPIASRHWVVLDDPEQAALYLQNWPHDTKDFPVTCWADLPSRASEVEHLIAYFHALSHPAFRTAERLEHNLRFLERLRSLTIPISFVPGLDPDALPASLGRISVAGQGRVAFSNERVFPGIQILDVWPTLSAPKSEVKFDASVFPNLQEIACRLDKKRTLLSVVASYPRLASLRMGPIKDSSVFSGIGTVALDFLRLKGGSLASLDGIEKINGMRCLELEAMDRMTDISALEACKDLEILQIRWCANLRDHTPLLRIPKLKSIFLFRCNALDPAACASDLASRPELKTRIWACTGSRHVQKS